VFLDLIVPENNKSEHINLRPKIWTVIIHSPWIKVIVTNSFFVTFAKLWKAVLASSRISIDPRGTTRNSAATGRIYIKLDIWKILGTLSRKFKFRRNPTRITGTSRVDVSTFMITRWIILRMENVSEKVAEKIKTHTLCSISISSRKSHLL